MKDKVKDLIKKYTEPRYINLFIALTLLLTGITMIMADKLLGVFLAFVGGYLLTMDFENKGE
jgi:hypothetical protein